MNFAKHLRDEYPEHDNFQSHLMGEDLDLFKGFPEKWRSEWEVNRFLKQPDQTGTLKPTWPCVDLGDGWFAMETDDDLEFSDYTFYRQKFLVCFWGIRIPRSLQRVLTIHFRGGHAQSNPADLRRAFNMGLREVICKFMAPHP